MTDRSIQAGGGVRAVTGLALGILLSCSSGDAEPPDGGGDGDSIEVRVAANGLRGTGSGSNSDDEELEQERGRLAASRKALQQELQELSSREGDQSADRARIEAALAANRQELDNLAAARGRLVRAEREMAEQGERLIEEVGHLSSGKDERIARRERLLARREAALAKREAALARREAALAKKVSRAISDAVAVVGQPGNDSRKPNPPSAPKSGGANRSGKKGR
jgi:hypothetical protein